MRTFRRFARFEAAPLDLAACAVLCVVSVIALFTFRDYGLGWDDYSHSQYGEMLYSYYLSGFTDLRAFHFVNLHYYGGGFDIAATLLGKVLPFNMFDTRRLLGAVVGILGMVVVWRTARRLGSAGFGSAESGGTESGPLAGLAALLLIATAAPYYGHMFVNAKDTPFAVAMIFLIYSLVRAFDEYPKPRASTILIFALALGLTIGTRVIGLIAVAFAGIAFLFLIAGEWRQQGLRPALTRAVGFCGWLALALPLAYIVMGLIWPWSVRAPLNPINALEYFSHFWEKPWREMYDGVPTPILDMPRTYLPKLCFLKFPEIFIGLGLAGAAGATVASLRGGLSPQRRAQLMLVVSAAVLPILLAVATKPVLYNGMRHFLFVSPAFAVLGGLAAAYSYGLLKQYRFGLATSAAAIFIALIGWTTVDLARIHPYQYALFNHAAGGMQRASQRYMTDYWGLGFKEVASQMIERLRREHWPEDRKWRVAVCGPPTSATIELGPHFVASIDATGADFAISLGTFYCAQLDAPVLAEAGREGVVFARAYDLRGRHYVTTWVPEPPITTDIASAGHKANTFWHE
ncbi:MAG TPA: hypothetical protein VNR41_01755 [Xanthobacteraceae bacterium]|nr:hypothetical protein [Xanthobacteraceae bacterium]